MFFQLASLMRSQYHYSLVQSHVVAFRAARAAFAFKRGNTRAEYEAVIPDLAGYYSSLRDKSTTPFNADSVAALELEWWIVHRQRTLHEGGDLDRALANAAGAFYRVSPGTLKEYSRYRSEAMKIRDEHSEKGSLTERDWTMIGDLLQRSWRSLWRGFHPSARAFARKPTAARRPMAAQKPHRAPCSIESEEFVSCP